MLREHPLYALLNLEGGQELVLFQDLNIRETRADF